MNEAAERVYHPGWSDDDLFAVIRGHRKETGPARREALELLFDRYHARVHAQCSRLLGDPELADDATQEIFLRLYERPPRYQGRESFGSWLYIVVRNHCLNLLRRRSKEARHDPDEPWARLLVDPTDPERDYRHGELSEMVSEICTMHLTPREQQVVHLRYGWGLRVKQISEILGLDNVSGARTHLATATRKLQKAFETRLGAEGIRGLLGEE